LILNSDRMKKNARILDATAANRTIWKTKESPHIFWIDIEDDLTIKPDKIMDCRNTGFDEGVFHTIYFDPPHEFGRTKNTSVYTTPNTSKLTEKWPNIKRTVHCYYGADKYKTRSDLMEFIFQSQQEFNRILSDDGQLWLKWSENRIKLNEILGVFVGWTEMMRIPIKTLSENATPSYWIMLMKQHTAPRQGTL